MRRRQGGDGGLPGLHPTKAAWAAIRRRAADQTAPWPPPAPPCRVAGTATSMADAKRLNAEHYARFYGKPKAKDMMF